MDIPEILPRTNQERAQEIWTKRWTLAVGSLPAIYYSLLSAKQLTWLFGSGDSAGWLLAARSWQVPQPFGNPVFVLLGHALDALPGDLVVKMTIVGSGLASAVTVALTGAIATRLTSSIRYGLLSVGILLASAVFLTQATVLSQYPLAVLAVVVAFWFYLTDHRKLAIVALGIGTAMHVVVAMIALLWLLVAWQQGEWQKWLRLVPLYLAVGLLPYSLTLWELWQAHGALSLSILSAFTSNTSGAGALSVFAFPARLFWFIGLMVVSLGTALVPMWWGLRDRSAKGYWLMVAPIAFVCWYYLTTLDPTVWHYLPWAMPFLAVFAGIGTQKLASRWRTIVPVVAGSAAMLLIANSVLLNASVEAEHNPVAMNLYRQFATLPQDAKVDIPSVGWEGFMFRYVQLNERPDLVRGR